MSKEHKDNTRPLGPDYGLVDDDEELGATTCCDDHPRTLHAALMRFIQWREKHVKEKNFVLVLALFVGIFAGLAAMVLKWLDTQHKPPAHDTHRRVAGQYPVYPSSCCGRGARGTICALCG